MNFKRRGVRKSPGYGLSYLSEDGTCELYKSDFVSGIPVLPVRWLAITHNPMRILSRHRTREAATQSLNRHLTPKSKRHG